MATDSPDPAPESVSSECERLIMAGEKIFKKARSISNKYSGTTSDKPALRDPERSDSEQESPK
ncbi:MAG TPA: hypothetical protein VFG14_09610 [Chthoniobacteraceae bacterium]|nr:hypothetical protein [Chthoniobacteraceae bacterium]